MSDIWQQVRDLVQQGKGAQINVASDSEMNTPRNTGPGRPQVRDFDNPFIHYATPRKGKAHPRCLSCKCRLKVDDVSVCSVECRRLALDYMSKQLRMLHSGTVGLSVPVTNRAAQMIEEVTNGTT